jgi:Ni,Fe-hydrogenase I large subunit
MKKITINPFSRVEGDLKIKVEVKDGVVTDASASGILFRGFERLLRGRDPMDALVYTCRICGICSVSQSVAASNALRDAFSVQMPPNAYFARNIILATEVIMNHTTHFYIFFAVDFTNKRYMEIPAYKELAKRFIPFEGSSYIKAIRERKKILEILGIFAGKWPNTLALQPGGTTRPVNTSEIIRAMGILREFQDFVEENLLGCSIERWLENKTLEDVQKWLSEAEHENSDLGVFIRLVLQLGLDKLGKGPGKYLSCGGYDLPDGDTWLKGGYSECGMRNAECGINLTPPPPHPALSKSFWRGVGGEVEIRNPCRKPFDREKIVEYIEYSYFEGYEGGRHPSEGITEPNVEKAGAYSWVKSPRYDGNVVEVGPFARMINDEDALTLDIVKKCGSNVYTRNLVRLHESISLLKQLNIWLGKIDPNKPFYKKPEKKTEARGIGLTEAARGILGHWIDIKNGRIKNYQVITPTTWNFSPRDSNDNPGAAEQALIGTPVEDEKNPIEIAHVIRSFDPCLFCSVC